MVTVSALGAVMCTESEGTVTDTVGDKGAMMVRLAPGGPYVMMLQAAGET